MKQIKDNEEINQNDSLIIVIKDKKIQGMYSNVPELYLDVDIIDYDLQTIDTEEENRRKRLELELKTMIEI